jgi:hypothetical protein
MEPNAVRDLSKRLRAHNCKALVVIILVFAAYFAALFLVIRWALAS